MLDDSTEESVCVQFPIFMLLGRKT